MNVRRAALALLDARAKDATVCPSEVARALQAAAEDHSAAGWRRLMPMVHAAVDDMLADGTVQISWKGQRLRKRSGPYRIGRHAAEDDE